MTRDLGLAAGSIGALEDDIRRALYLFARRHGRPISREEAAAAVGISRKLAAFHLDKLVDRGLLTAHYARPPGRSGPGAGRSAKFYEPAGDEISVTLPPRGYDLVGEILVDAIQSPGSNESPRDSARRVARDAGRALAERFRRQSGLRAAGPERALSIARQILEDHGYEPYRDDRGALRLHNCPFHALSRRSPDLVCGLNQAFIDGLLRGLGNNSVDAVLDPQPNECCVRLQPPTTSK